MQEKPQLHSLKEWTKKYGSTEKNLINIFDLGFKGFTMMQSECICGGKVYKQPRFVEYVHNRQKWDGITYFTDKFIHRKRISSVESKVKVAILTEPRSLQPEMYESMEGCMDTVDLVLTHDRNFLSKYPTKSRFFICSCPIISYEDTKLHPKTKLCSMILSSKTQLDGHQLRHDIYNELRKDPQFDFIDYYGDGVGNYVTEKIDTLRDYMFSITIENNKKDFYFTEKIFDCFATGTIPIFWGCPSIGHYFDRNGIKSFSSIEQLKIVLNEITELEYQKHFNAIENNFNYVQKFVEPDDVAFNTVIQYLKDTGRHTSIVNSVI